MGVMTMSRQSKCFWDMCFIGAFIVLSWLSLVYDIRFLNNIYRGILSIVFTFVWYLYIFYNGQNNHKKRLVLIAIWCVIAIATSIFCISIIGSHPIIDSTLINMLYYSAISPLRGIQYIVSDVIIVCFIIIGIYVGMFVLAIYLLRYYKK